MNSGEIITIMFEGKDFRASWQQIKKGEVPLFTFTFNLHLNWQDFGALNPLNGSLQRGVEGSEAFEVFAEELGADGEFLARGPDVDDSAADGVIAFLLDLRAAIIAEFREAVGEFQEPSRRMQSIAVDGCRLPLVATRQLAGFPPSQSFQWRSGSRG